MVKMWKISTLIVVMLLSGVGVLAQQPVVLAPIADNQYTALYTGPGTNYNILRQLSEDNILTLVGRNEDGSWVYGITANQIEGWARTARLDPRGDIFVLPVYPITAAARGEVIPSRLNMRRGPSEAFGILAQVEIGLPMNLIGRSSNNTWVQATIAGYTGWVDARYVDSNTDLDNLPITSYLGSPPPLAVPQGVVTARNLNVRHGAGTQFHAFASVEQNQYVWLIARTPETDWLLVQLPSGQVGWVSAQFIRTQFYTVNLPVAN